MTLSSVAACTATGYAGVGSLFVVLFVYAETFGQSNRPWWAGLRHILPMMPVIGPVCLVFWPLILAIAWAELRREQTFFQATSGLPPVPARELTESDWLRGKDAALLLGGLGRRLSARKRHLIAAACCRRVWGSIADERSRQAVVVAERFACGLATAGELQTACNEARTASGEEANGEYTYRAAAARACLDATLADAAGAAYRATFAAPSRRKHEAKAQCDVVRDIVGNPFRPLPPRDFPPEVRALACAIEQGDAELRPLLADALAELGEDEAAEHLRRPEHARGCHVLDWVLGHG